MNEQRIVSIEVFPHLKCWMAKTYIKNPAGAFVCSEATTLGQLTVLALLDRRTWKKTFDDQFRDRKTVTIKLEITHEQLKMSPRLFKLKALSITLDRIFKEHLVTSLMMMNAGGIPVYLGCKLFLKQYGIDESEYSVDNCYKVWQRSKDRRELTVSEP